MLFQELVQNSKISTKSCVKYFWMAAAHSHAKSSLQDITNDDPFTVISIYDSFLRHILRACRPTIVNLSYLGTSCSGRLHQQSTRCLLQRNDSIADGAREGTSVFDKSCL